MLLVVTESYLHHGKIITIVKDVKSEGMLCKSMQKYNSYPLNNFFSGTGITCHPWFYCFLTKEHFINVFLVWEMGLDGAANNFHSPKYFISKHAQNFQSLLENIYMAPKKYIENLMKYYVL